MTYKAVNKVRSLRNESREKGPRLDPGSPVTEKQLEKKVFAGIQLRILLSLSTKSSCM